MDKTFEEFRLQYIQEIKNDSRIEGMTPSQYFFVSFLDKLQQLGEISDPQEITTCVDKICRNNRKMSVDGFGFDDSDKSLALYTNDYLDSVEFELVNREQIATMCNKMLYFLEEVYDDKLDLYFDHSNELIKIGKQIEDRLKKDFVDLENDNSIDKIKLFIITNKGLSERVKSFELQPFKDKKVEVHIWSIQRIYDLFLSGRDREIISLDVAKFGFDGIACIKADMSGATDYDAYLAIIPGVLLHKIYYEYGSKLLEGNIRAFLSTKGKINKGIRTTIIKEPTKFFTYNNGIACTAANVELNENCTKILKMDDLQIINGGQTTASMTQAFIKDKNKLDNIFVPMKLTVVKNDDYDTVIANIARYANSQNKVTDADLFSNHPFHRKFEELANKTLAPANNGSFNDTLWYYERSRGKYQQEKFRLTTKVQEENYTKKRPKDQVIKKEELAKYFMTANELRPDIVAKGSQFCMQAFAKIIDKNYSDKSNKLNELFFKKAICYAILYKTTDRLVNKSDWYRTGGYKLNIVPYTISKLMTLIPHRQCLNWDKIWRQQQLSQATMQMLNKIAFVTDKFIQGASRGMIVTEFCKKEDAWNQYKGLKNNANYMDEEYNFGLNEYFLGELIYQSDWDRLEDAANKVEKLTKEQDNANQLYSLGREHWMFLIREGIERELLSTKELDILHNIASQIVVTSAELNTAMRARKKLEDAGVVV